MVPCPRCRRPTDDAARACPACGAPLAFRDEPAPGPLDASFTIDRRGSRPAPAQRDQPARQEELAALERSHWDLGHAVAASRPVLATTAEPDEVSDVQMSAREVRVRRAASWRRGAAWAIDGLPFGAGGVALARSLIGTARAGLTAPPTGVEGFLDLLARERVIVLSVATTMTLALAVYATLAHALAGATLGKLILRLRVIGPDGARPSLARSTARTAVSIASAAALGLGFLLALFTRSGRSLHDLLARTWVIEAP